MAFAHKAGVAATAHGSTGANFQVIAAGPFAVGDLIVVLVSAGSPVGSQSVVSVTDHLGNSYAQPTNGLKQYNAGAGGGSSSAVEAVYLSVCTVAGTPTVFVSVQRSADWGWAVAVDGFTGLSGAVDVTSTPATGAAGVAPSIGASGATTNGNELGLSLYADMGGGDANQAASTWTLGAQVSGNNDNNLVIQYKDSGAIGSTLSAGTTMVSGTPNQPWAYLLVVLKLSAVAGVEAGHAADSAAALVLGGTTPGVGDRGAAVDFAQVAVVGDAPGLPGWGNLPAPSWANYRPVPNRYTYYFVDLQTRQLLAVLPLQQVKWSLLLNQAGTFSAEIHLSDRRLIPNPDVVLAATNPEQAVLFIDRGGQIVGHASILTRDYDLATDTLKIAGQDLWHWFSRRLISDDLSYNEDMLQIQRDVVRYAQAKVNGDLGIIVSDTVFSGVTRQRNYLAVDRKVVGTVCEELANLSQGFEFRVRAHWSNGTILTYLEQAYPHFGVPAASAAFFFAYPTGSILSFGWPEDASNTAGIVHALGNQQADGTRPITTSAAASTYPLTEVSLTFEVDGVNDLQPFADAQQAARADPIIVPKVTVYGPSEPVFGTYQEGDHARYRVRAGVSGRFWGGMDTVWRVIGLDISVRDDGSEEVSHLLAPAV